jgi:hypothetical protein
MHRIMGKVTKKARMSALRMVKKGVIKSPTLSTRRR